MLPSLTHVRQGRALWAPRGRSAHDRSFMDASAGAAILPSCNRPPVGSLALAVLAVLALSCTPSAAPPEAASSSPAGCQEVNPYRDKARYVLEVHCGLCHRQDSPRAQERALAIYNLNELDWARSLDAQRLEDLVTQLQENAVTRGTEEVETLQRFVEMELSLRACRRR